MMHVDKDPSLTRWKRDDNNDDNNDDNDDNDDDG